MFVAFVFVLALWSVGEIASESEVCQTTRGDCGLYDAPSSKDRVCRMHGTLGDYSLEWYTGTLDSPRCTNSRTTSRDFLFYCPGYVGMNMSLWCDFVDVTSVIYKDGVPLTGEPTVTFNRLQKEHEGLYQCRRNDSLELIEEFNMTVQSEIHIGGANTQECVPFNCNPFTERKCCYYNSWSPSPSYLQRNMTPISLSVYGDAPISYSLSMEWTTDSMDHYPTDLGLVNNSRTDPNVWEINFRHYPANVNNNRLRAVIVFTASNNISSFSTCITLSFFPSFTRVYIVNTSLPQDANTTVGGNATFFCEFGSNSVSPAAIPLLRFKFSIPNEDGEHNSAFTTECPIWDACSDWSPSLPSTELSILPTRKGNENIFPSYHYEVWLTNVVPELNGSQFSCSISTGPENLIQWEGTADLIVEPVFVEPTMVEPTFMKPTMIESTLVPQTTELPENPKISKNINGEVIAAAAVVLIVILLALVTTVSVLLATFMKWRRKHREPYELAQVPLTSLSQPATSQSTVNPEAESTIIVNAEQYKLPTISIMETAGVHRDVIVGREVLQETRSTDSGVSCTEDFEHMRRPPNTLQMTRAQHQKLLESISPVRLCRSEADLADSPSIASMRTPRKKSVIYISYTDHASQWVRATLKPLIDSWNIAEVMLPDRDMVAGKAVSNERRRLIVEADKIIVVISPDYYDSDWCSYELMHAIQNEPTLSRGRIIPVLIDGCKHLPKNMEVVVPLFAHEQDFSQRLLAAVYPHSRLSLQ